MYLSSQFQVDNGLQPTEQELHEDYSRYFLAKQKVKKRKRTDIAKEDESAKEQEEETVMKGKDYEKSENGGEIHMNEEVGDNVGKLYNDIMPRKARIKGKNDSNSELRTLRKITREEISTAVCAVIDEISAIAITEPTKQRSNVAETDFDVVSIRVDEDCNQDDHILQRKSKRCNLQGVDEIPCFMVDLFEHPNHDEKAKFDEWIKVGLQRTSK